ncbi:hypothetical protein HS125_03330 [bacterium]|nr:hypothetical protein [bacterium]
MHWLKHPVVVALGIAVVAVGFGKLIERLAAETYHPFLYAAYTLSFIAFFFYLRSLDARTAEVKREIDSLRKELRK